MEIRIKHCTLMHNWVMIRSLPKYLAIICLLGGGMVLDNEALQEIPDLPLDRQYSSHHVSFGMPIPAINRVRLFSSDEWEEFVQEWAHSLKDKYVSVKRYGGPGDQGLDVIGFKSADGFEDAWDNYQCKHYDHPLYPSDVWPEIAKIIYYSFIGEYTTPIKCYFVAPQDVGKTLATLLGNPAKLKSEAESNWPENGITSTRPIPLEGALLEHFKSFDFSIFSSRSVLDIINDHRRTLWHALRFGGGLPPRDEPLPPPDEVQEIESRYITQLMEAYSDHLGETVEKTALGEHQQIENHFNRQRELFFHAEGLRSFSRDNVPEGTFESLLDEIFDGVIDICENPYLDGLARVRATVSHAAVIQTQANPLSSVVKVKDKQGICHHLANEDRLIWVLKEM